MTVGSDMIIFGGNILSETLNFGVGGERMKILFGEPLIWLIITQLIL